MAVKSFPQGISNYCTGEVLLRWTMILGAGLEVIIDKIVFQH